MFPTPLSKSFAGVGVAIQREAEARAAGLLSERDVRALADWTTVEIVWHGGNGPHRYRIVHVGGLPYAALPRGDAFSLGDPVDCVGADRGATRVRLPSDAPWPPPSPRSFRQRVSEADVRVAAADCVCGSVLCVYCGGAAIDAASDVG